jgi:hypothetical protein
MVKAALREGITMLINVRERILLTSWVAEHMPNIPITYGNVLPSHPFYRSVYKAKAIDGNTTVLALPFEAKNISDDANIITLPWISREIISPSGHPLPVWNFPKATIIAPDSRDFIEYISNINH